MTGCFRACGIVTRARPPAAAGALAGEAGSKYGHSPRPPSHIQQAQDEAFLVPDGQFEGFCGDRKWRAGPGSLVFLPRAIPHGFTVSEAGPGRITIVVSPGGFDQFVTAAGEPAQALRLPEPVPPDPALITQLAAAHGIQILPPPQP
jgi:hypothetical protein